MDNIFPTPHEPIQDIFRICGKCSRCKIKSSHMIDNFKKTRIDVKEHQKLFPDEYILICSSGKALPVFSQMTSNNPPTNYISNYGRRFCINDHGRGCHGQIEEITDNWGKKIKLSPLTQEFINYYNSVNFMAGQWQHEFRDRDSLNMILEYQKNNEQINISYKIEQDKKRLQEIMKELQEKETDIVKQNQQIKDIKNDLLMTDKLLKEQNLELENRIGQHKKKSLKLLERENKVSVKESIETMQTELLNVSISISQLLDVVNEPILEGRIQQIINKLNEIKNTSGENLEQPVIVATEVVPQASAPEVCHAFQRGECRRGADCRFAHDEVLPSVNASLTSLFGK